MMTQGLVIFLIGQAILIFGGLLTIYVRVNVKLAELDLRMKVSENRLKDVEDTDHEMNSKLDKIIDKINDIKVDIQNKENRK